ncbi:hypothetical protein NIES4102_08960 [Chondrocystis sp. NIES-4102]|nr:hypothetical protein NIES4102_08960 [Chondrocystis sp. NIES-4102]
MGIVFDSSTGFKLPNGANRSPDAAWIHLVKWDALTKIQKQRFLPLCPDFAIQLLSPSDNLVKIQQKMQEYLDIGKVLGWLINCQNQQVEIYRQQKKVEVMDYPQSLSGENILPQFIW